MGNTLGRVGVLALVVLVMAAATRTPTVVAPSRSPEAWRDTIAVPDWLFPVIPPSPAKVWDTLTPLRVPRSRVAFTESQLRDLFFVPDWSPQSHPRMPTIVSRGRKPAVYACGFCHLPNGLGRPENAMIAGLPARYIIQQIADMKSHRRRSAKTGVYIPNDYMQRVADSATDAEVAIAAAYFAALKPRQRLRVIEASRVPRVTKSTGIYRVAPGQDSVALGERVVEIPADVERHERRDPEAEYVAYVPVGSITRGRALARSPVASGLLACTGCHGPELRGAGLIPPLAGRPPAYLVRQLLGFKTGARATAAGAPMRPVATALSLNDMIAVASYAASLRP